MWVMGVVCVMMMNGGRGFGIGLGIGLHDCVLGGIRFVRVVFALVEGGSSVKFCIDFCFGRFDWFCRLMLLVGFLVR